MVFSHIFSLLIIEKNNKKNTQIPLCGLRIGSVPAPPLTAFCTSDLRRIKNRSLFTFCLTGFLFFYHYYSNIKIKVFVIHFWPEKLYFIWIFYKTQSVKKMLNNVTHFYYCIKLYYLAHCSYISQILDQWVKKKVCRSSTK